ncbi:threonylcarbamoyl-AMP synthase [Bacillus sp. HMF5848]|uniref:L-threonylcarbamoyladenylate synthase n=1 Tax=Bacillus sp. HMF5848 TaxID=2495421 RepID=UPI000F782B45|nr:L-threonylcarbamoyladenylate synthase [Bacillus sp. HMF5848]RSK28956.1 threonylcarbamoyl-AMP synthase [Bacillus sp. HMF5848]
MKTETWCVDNTVELSTDNPHIIEAANLLKRGEVVAFPTETVYGLGANALSERAVEKIFVAKGRPSDNPLIVHIGSKEQLQDLVQSVTPHAHKLIEQFWPGPLTLVLPKKAAVAHNVTAGLESVAIRMPNHPVALTLLKAANVPIAAPSANLSGKPSPTEAKHVYADLAGKIAGILDGGVTGVGLESTVVDCTTELPIILRPGGVTKEQLEEAVDCEVLVDKALQHDVHIAPRSPGMKYVHYAPDAPLQIVEGDLAFIQAIVNDARKAGKRVGVLTTTEQVNKYEADAVLACGERKNLTSVAQQLFATLRSFNTYDLDVIFSESFPREGIGEAIMNRLTKAAGGHVIKY